MFNPKPFGVFFVSIQVPTEDLSENCSELCIHWNNQFRVCAIVKTQSNFRMVIHPIIGNPGTAHDYPRTDGNQTIQSEHFIPCFEVT